MAPPSFAFALMRTAVLSLAQEHPAVRSLINPRQSSAIAYTGSPLNAPQDETWSAGPAPGTVLPECPLTLVEQGGETARHMTDLLGQGFTVFQFNAVVAGLPAALQGKTLEFYPETSEVIETAAQWTQAWNGGIWTAQVPLSPQRANSPAVMPMVLASGGQGWRSTTAASAKSGS